jgi:serine/threonine-protein kinase
LTAAAAARTDMRERLRREARATAAIGHPNVVKALDIVDDEDGMPILVMEYLSGEPLGNVIERERSLSVEYMASLMLPVVSAVGTAHELGIVHRDLKPDNIFLVRRDDGDTEPYVLDFGLAKVARGEDDVAQKRAVTQTGAILGTTFYMSPEQASGERNIDARTDVWSIGVILYECLSGRLPVSGENFGQFFRRLIAGKITPIQTICPSVPDDLARVIGMALKIDRWDRLSDLREIDTALRRHTRVQMPTFGAARDILQPTGDPVVTVDPLPTGAPTLVSPPTSAGAVTAAGAGRQASSTSRGQLTVAVAMGAVVAFGAGVLLLPSVRRATAKRDAATVMTMQPAIAASLSISAATSAPTSTSMMSTAQTPENRAVATPATAAPTSASSMRPSTRKGLPSSKHADAAAPSNASPDSVKLQGGVAGEVPF